jgi:TolA-binding protein
LKKVCIALTLWALALPGIEGGARESKQPGDVISNILNEEAGEKAPDKKKPSPVNSEPAGGREKIDSLKPSRKKGASDSVQGGDKKGESGGEETPPQISSEEQVLFKTGVDFYNSGLYEHAQKKFQELAAKFPKSPLLDGSHAWLGKSNLKLYKYDDAIKEFSAIPADSAEYPAAVFFTGESFQMKGDQLSAIENFERVYSRFPQNELADKALLNAGKLYLNQNKGAQSLDAAVKLIKYYKDRDTIDDAYYLLAKIFENDAKLKDIETARKIYRLFIKKGETDERFGKSPLKKRVEQDLARIERTYFKFER